LTPFVEMTARARQATADHNPRWLDMSGPTKLRGAVAGTRIDPRAGPVPAGEGKVAAHFAWDGPETPNAIFWPMKAGAIVGAIRSDGFIEKGPGHQAGGPVLSVVVAGLFALAGHRLAAALGGGCGVATLDWRLLSACGLVGHLVLLSGLGTMDRG
jgi:hypothetical protein